MFASAADAEQAFYRALAHGDLEGLMQVWATDEEVVCVHPGGLRVIGHLAVRESWQAILAHGPLTIETSKLTEQTTVVSATHCLIEQISAQSPGGTQFAYCYATNVFHKTASGWRLVLHHASAAPQSAGAFDLHDKPGTLH
jgi:ketosteroid isomerase-like protein